MNRLAWIPALGLANLRSELVRPWNVAVLATFMALNNFVWFVVWGLFFGLAGDVRGWTLRDVTEIYGILAVAYGIDATFFGGARNVALFVHNGALDVYLGRPRSPLLGVLFSRCDPTGFGDIASGVVLIAWAAGSAAELLLALVFATIGSCVLVAVYVTINCLAFWSSARPRLCDQLFEAFLQFAMVPQIGLPVFVKALLYTALPAAFVAFVPVEILRNFSLGETVALVAAAAVFPAVAAGVFGLGLRRYASGSRVFEGR
ncbi:MAG TPA: ABC-2 family transporter protein [Gammaproteobacteria bacterium]|nr:ABC-2 family transporter protein [Gammaproteobacteria bacterium]